jgi:Tfp pilus assembly protein PilV
MAVKRKAAGVTLVELMIALAIMATAIIGVVAVIIQTIKAKEKVREVDIAKQAIATKMEELRVMDWADLSNQTNVALYGTLVKPAPYYTRTPSWDITELRHTSLVRNGRALGYIEPRFENPDLLDITIRLEWVGVGGPREHSVRSMFTR